MLIQRRPHYPPTSRPGSSAMDLARIFMVSSPMPWLARSRDLRTLCKGRGGVHQGGGVLSDMALRITPLCALCPETKLIVHAL